MPDRIDARPLIAMAGALILLISLFLDWFAPGLSAWTLFEAWDLVLAIIAVTVILLGLERVRETAAPSDRLAPALGVLALLIVASQLIDPPPAVADASLETGAWLALAGALILFIGAALTAAHVSLSVVLDRGPVRAPRRSRPPAAAGNPPTEVDPRGKQPPGDAGAPDETRPL